MDLAQYFSDYLIFINLLAYLTMSLDKLKSVYQWWRMAERSLWILAIFGGVFGIWLGMYWPMYHKAGKRNFRIWIPVIGIIWIFILLYFIK